MDPDSTGMEQGQTDITGQHQSGQNVATTSASVTSMAFVIIAGAVIGLWLLGMFYKKG